VKLLRQLCTLLVFLLASCASDKSDRSSNPTPRSLSSRLSGEKGYVRDSNGNWKPSSDRRSQFESKGQSPLAKKDFKKQDYQTGDYARKSWWGNKSYDRQSYAGNTDGSRFQTSSALDGKGAREARQNASDGQKDYRTDSYATSAAREAGTAGMAPPDTARNQVDQRRKVFQQPEIVDWKEQRSLSLDQSKGLLGR
jgi:hypothetical protein